MKSSHDEPELGEERSYVTIKEQARGYDCKEYVVMWRGLKASGKSVSEALRELASSIEGSDQIIDVPVEWEYISQDEKDSTIAKFMYGFSRGDYEVLIWLANTIISDGEEIYVIESHKLGKTVTHKYAVEILEKSGDDVALKDEVFADDEKELEEVVKIIIQELNRNYF